MAQEDFEQQGFEEARLIARRRRRRILIPLIVVVLMVLALIGSTLFNYFSMRDDALALSRTVVANLQSRIETEIKNYLGPIPSTLTLLRDLSGSSGDEATKRRVVAGVLNNTPQLTAVFAATLDGGFYMVRRSTDAAKPFEVKAIRVDPEDPSDRHILFSRLDGKGRQLSQERQPWDDYDPRQRPWFAGGASASSMAYWTDVYPFFTGNTAGVTASLAQLDDNGGLRRVVGVDVTLNSLREFLGRLQIGRSGAAMIVDRQGRLIAHPAIDPVVREPDLRLRVAAIDDLDQPLIARAFDHFRVEGHGAREFTFDGKRYISSASSLSGLLQRPWSILVVVPEDDFVGFVVSNVRKTLAMGLSVIALASMLAALLIRQGLRTDRAATEVLQRQTELDARAQVLGQLSDVRAGLLAGKEPAALQKLTECLTGATQVRRAALWALHHSPPSLNCLDCYDTENQGHTQGARLSAAQHPDLFDALNDGQSLAVTDAAADPRLESLYRQYLAPLNCRSLLALPFASSGKIDHVLWLEHQALPDDWSERTIAFARAVSRLLSLNQASDTPAAPMPAPGERAIGMTGTGVSLKSLAKGGMDTSLEVLRAQRFASNPVAPDADPLTQAVAFEHTTVLALRLTNAQALAEPAAADPERTTLSLLLQQLQEAADKHGIAYLKFLNDQLIAAADPHEPANQGLQSVLDFGLRAKELCESELSKHRAALAFRIGIDFGPALGGVLSHRNPSFSLWGEAVQTATHMADTSLPGGIQTTEAVYRRCQAQYLFQLRGQHYVQGLGEFATYLLQGHL